MPRYFFTIRGRDRVENDPSGTYLPDVAAAPSYAEYTIRELRKKSGYGDLALMMIVTDQARQTVLSPGRSFYPALANARMVILQATIIVSLRRQSRRELLLPLIIALHYPRHLGRSRSPRTRRGASRRISPSCRSRCCGPWPPVRSRSPAWQRRDPLSEHIGPLREQQVASTW